MIASAEWSFPRLQSELRLLEMHNLHADVRNLPSRDPLLPLGMGAGTFSPGSALLLGFVLRDPCFHQLLDQRS